MLIYFKAGTVTSGNRGHAGRKGKKGGSAPKAIQVIASKLSIKANSKIATESDNTLRNNPLPTSYGYFSQQEAVGAIRSKDYILSEGKSTISHPYKVMSALQGFDRPSLSSLDTDDYTLYGENSSGGITDVNNEYVVKRYGIVNSAKKISESQLYSEYDKRVTSLYADVKLIEDSHLGNPDNTDLSNLTSKEWKEKKLELMLISGSVETYAIMQGYDVLTTDSGKPHKILNNTCKVELDASIKIPEPELPNTFPTDARLNSPRINALVDRVKNTIKGKEDILIKRDELRRMLVASRAEGHIDLLPPDKKAEHMKLNDEYFAIEKQCGSINDEVFDILSVDNPSTSTANIKSTFSAKAKKRFPEMMGMVDGIVNRDLMDRQPSIYIDKTTKRAAANGRYIRTSGSDDSVFIHEYGHVIEGNSQLIKTRANNYLNQRTKGETATSMKDYGLSSEFSRRDKFLSPYMGKTYGDGATEIISMGLEYMSIDPVGFLQADEDYFRFMVWALQDK